MQTHIQEMVRFKLTDRHSQTDCFIHQQTLLRDKTLDCKKKLAINVHDAVCLYRKESLLLYVKTA